MQSPSSKRAESSEAPIRFSSLFDLALSETTSEQNALTRTSTLAPRPVQVISRLPESCLDADDDVTPETEQEAATWVALMRKDPKGWLKKLRPHTQHWQPTDLAADFETMYREYADRNALRLFQSRVRRPDAAADAKPFPLKVWLFNLVFCALIALMIGVALLISR